MTDEKNRPLPDGWAHAILGQVLNDIQPGFASGKHTSGGSGLPHLRPMNVTRDGKVDRSNLRLIAPELADKPTRRLRKGDVLFNNTNSLELVGKTALFNAEDDPAFSNHMTRLRVEDGLIDPAFVARLLHGRWQVGEFRQLANNHVSQASVSRTVLEDLPVLLPPLAEQRRIAKRLDEIEYRRSSINSHIQAVREGLGRLQQAVLSAACTGRLTEDWRERHPHTAVEDLLSCAEERRRAHSNRFVEPRLNAHAKWNDLPEGWTLAPLGLLLEDLKYGTSKKSTYDQPGTPVLRIPNVSAGVLDVKDLKFAALKDREVAALKLRVGDLLMVRSNGSIQLVGVTAAVTSAGENMAYAGYLMRLRVDPEFLKPEFLHLILASSQLRHQIEFLARSTSGVHNINSQEVRGLGVPVPSVDEQVEIARRAAVALGTADRLSAHLEQAAQTLDRVSGAVLTKAFRGELVPTEAALAAEEGRDYETAEELLARVKAKTRQ